MIPLRATIETARPGNPGPLPDLQAAYAEAGINPPANEQNCHDTNTRGNDHVHKDYVPDAAATGLR